MKSTTLIVALCLFSAHAIQMEWLLGKQADPCANELWNGNTPDGVWRNCVQAGKPLLYPVTQGAVLLPLSHPQIPDSVKTVSIIGRNFFQWGRRQNGANPATTTVVPPVPADDQKIVGSLCLAPQMESDPALYCTRPQPINLCVDLYFVNDTLLLVQIPLTAANPNGWLPWTSVATVNEIFPRPLCITDKEFPKPAAATNIDDPNRLFWSGFTARTIEHCVSDAACVAQTVAVTASRADAAVLRGKTKCCVQSNNLRGAWKQGDVEVKVNQCYNPNVETCCGGTLAQTTQEKCCNTNLQTVAFLEQPCICRLDTDCAEATGRSFKCCVAQPFADFGRRNQLNTELAANVFPDTIDLIVQGPGQCYDTARERCCTDGKRYDPGSHQCCAIGGLQNLEAPCLCSSDEHCRDTRSGDTVRSQSMSCCRNRLVNGDGSPCFGFGNVNSNNIGVVDVGCRGTCIDTRFQTCCNGVTCRREFESCCNTTCCNKFVGSCKFARQSGAPGFPYNPLNFRDVQRNTAVDLTGIAVDLLFDQCTIVEHLDTVKGFLLFALPAILLLSTLSALALALVFANKSSPRRYSFLERILIIFAVISILLVLPVFFSPLYKYAEVVVLASLVAIITAAVRVRWLNIFAIIVLAITVIYIFDPFYGNAWLTLAHGRVFSTDLRLLNTLGTAFGMVDQSQSGILHSTAQLFMNHTDAINVGACTTFYDYFRLDQNLLDLDRRDFRERVTFGYCSRAFVIALLFFEGFVAIFVLLQLIIAMLALIVRFRKQRFDPIELEVMAVPVDY